jgi:hypothetical protein
MVLFMVELNGKKEGSSFMLVTMYGILNLTIGDGSITSNFKIF